MAVQRAVGRPRDDQDLQCLPLSIAVVDPRIEHDGSVLVGRDPIACSLRRRVVAQIEGDVVHHHPAAQRSEAQQIESEHRTRLGGHLPQVDAHTGLGAGSEPRTRHARHRHTGSEAHRTIGLHVEQRIGLRE